MKVANFGAAMGILIDQDANHHAIHAGVRAIIEVSGHQHQWLASGYDLKIEHF